MNYSNTTLDNQVHLDFITIPLTKGYEAIIDSSDSHLSSFKWCALEGKSGLVYAARRSYEGEKDRFILMHRVILSYVLAAELVTDQQCDHRDGNTLNNRRGNLRLASKSQNGLNKRMRSDNSTGVVGVQYRSKSNKWIAEIQFKKKKTFLGSFDTFEEARDARFKAEIEVFGEFSVLSSRGYRP